MLPGATCHQAGDIRRMARGECVQCNEEHEFTLFLNPKNKNKERQKMKKGIFFIYGLIAYLGFLFVYLYLIGFMGNFLVPKSIDSGVGENGFSSYLINFLLIFIFGLQHAVMARPSFKKWWTQFIPKPIERSTYVLITNLLFVLIIWFWRPIPSVIWDVGEGPARALILVLFGAGWLLVVVSSFSIDHFDLFGLRQVYLYLVGKPYTHGKFMMTGFYKYIRHPLMLGWIIAFWSAPIMTTGHLFFAVCMTIYIFIGIKMEEKDLMKILGGEYVEYRGKTSMLLPFTNVGKKRVIDKP
jgi:protein-S-isoprenylcysteine O-methyltransferase Ste14